MEIFLQNLIELDEIASTNDYLKLNYKYLPDFSTVIANFQTQGRGQFDRIWESNKNQNLLISILFKKEKFNATNDSFVFANAILKTLKEYKVKKATFKYPNDIFVKEKKLAGILIEKKYHNNLLEYMIVGIGVNLNQQKFKNPHAISLKNIIKTNVDIKEFAKKFLTNLSIML